MRSTFNNSERAPVGSFHRPKGVGMCVLRRHAHCLYHFGPTVIDPLRVSVHTAMQASLWCPDCHLGLYADFQQQCVGV